MLCQIACRPYTYAKDPIFRNTKHKNLGKNPLEEGKHPLVNQSSIIIIIFDLT